MCFTSKAGKYIKYRVAHKNVPNFAMMLYCSTIEFKQKEIIFQRAIIAEQHEKL